MASFQADWRGLRHLLDRRGVTACGYLLRSPTATERRIDALLGSRELDGREAAPAFLRGDRDGLCWSCRFVVYVASQLGSSLPPPGERPSWLQDREAY